MKHTLHISREYVARRAVPDKEARRMSNADHKELQLYTLVQAMRNDDALKTIRRGQLILCAVNAVQTIVLLCLLLLR